MSPKERQKTMKISKAELAVVRKIAAAMKAKDAVAAEKLLRSLRPEILPELAAVIREMMA
jgi:hypothetical protein